MPSSTGVLTPAVVLPARVRQTALHDPPDSIGNCQRACLASLLGCPIDDLPAFERDTYDDSLAWWQALNAVCRARGVSLAYVRNEAPPVGLALAFGKSPRGTQHIVIVRDGVLEHDPHPEGGGLVEVQGYEVLVPVHG